MRARPALRGDRYLVTLGEGLGVAEAAAELGRLGTVDYAEPNGTVRAFAPPNDPLYGLQWNMRMLDAERTWRIQTGDASVAVAVLDTGIAFEDHGVFRKAPDWGNVLFVRGYNVFSGDEHANDDELHGTHVASTVAEATDNGIGVTGLAFGCALMPVKVLDSFGGGDFFGVAEGVDYAVSFTESGRRPVKVINLSLGGSLPNETLRRAIDRALTAGVVVVAAAGNEGLGQVSFPASLPNVIAVGAVDARKQLADYSNYGSGLDVVAPGGDLDQDADGDGNPDGIVQQTLDVDALVLEDRYDRFSYYALEGTSQATPHVAALAALLVRQGITDPASVKAAIESTAEDLGTPGRDDRYGHGLIRPAVALRGLGFNR
jgi:serine protease